MEVVDLTLPIFPGCPTFPGQPAVVIFPWHDLSVHGSRTHALFMVDHTGTHVDAPAHFLSEGKTIETIALEKFTGEAVTFDVSPFLSEGVIGLSKFHKLLGGIKTLKGTMVLLYTGMDVLFGKREYFEQKIGISEEVAQFLVEQGIKGIGIDAGSIDPYPFAAHRILLSHEVLIFEGLTNLKRLLGKKAIFFGLPLKITGCSGSPIRAFALMG
ncbi:MAG: cyclase family protein [Candidatus Caldatribacteriaceae bacterium]